VVTDTNDLIYMRARYYSPELRRFVNADIIPGEISQAVTLNRYAYANGNPVSNVDPFGLAADEKDGNYSQAVLVSQFKYGGLPIVGHTQLYFYNSDTKSWSLAEFQTTGGHGLKEKKTNARIFWTKDSVPPVYDVESSTFRDVDGYNFVVLNGSFDESVALAEYYGKGEGKNYGKYNFFFHNCADYTNRLLDVADLDGMVTQISGESFFPVSIPVLREFSLSAASKFDSVTTAITEGLTNAGNDFRESGFWGNIAGDLLVGAGEFIDGSTNALGDFVDARRKAFGIFTDISKAASSVITNTIIDVTKTLGPVILLAKLH